MKVRKVSYAAFRRNMSFWIDLQAKGIEVHLMRGREVVGIMYGEPIVHEETSESRVRRGKAIYIRGAAKSEPESRTPRRANGH